MKTLLIDSNFLCYRAFYSTGNLEYNGVATGITYGFLNQFFNIVKETHPDQIIFFWDSKKNKRKELLPTYKSRNDDQTEEEKEMWKKAFKQFKMLRMKILPEIGLINNFIQIGYESDDLIAKYSLSNSNEKKYIATSDDDLLQLIDRNTHIYNLNKNMYYDEQWFIDKWKLHPHEWKEVKKIAGCSTDNVPGVPNVGEKTAAKFIRGELKSTYKTYKAIKDNAELIKFNEKLVALPFKGTTDITTQVQRNNFSMRDFLHVCREFGFNSFRRDEKKEEIRTLFL